MTNKKVCKEHTLFLSLELKMWNMWEPNQSLCVVSVIPSSGRAPQPRLISSGQFHSQKTSAAGGLEEAAVGIPWGSQAESTAGEKLSLVKKRAYPEDPYETESWNHPAHLLFSLKTMAPLEIRKQNWLMTEDTRYCEYRWTSEYVSAGTRLLRVQK